MHFRSEIRDVMLLCLALLQFLIFSMFILISSRYWRFTKRNKRKQRPIQTVKLGYKEQLGTGWNCSLNLGFVLTGLICEVNWSFGTEKCVGYNRVFVLTGIVITKFVITEFVMTKFFKNRVCHCLLVETNSELAG